MERIHVEARSGEPRNDDRESLRGRDTISTVTRGETRDAIHSALDLLDRGAARVAERQADGKWHVNQWLKKAVLLSFRLNPMEIIKGGPGEAVWWDKVPSKFDGWSAIDFEKAGFRAVPSSIVRRSAYVAPGAVLMPSFVNVGAYVDSGTMVDTWASVGSCAQIGKNVHLSGGVGIGGVLEPMQAGPTIIEDNCFIGARSEVVEGCIVREGSVLGMGVFIGQSTKIVDRATGEFSTGSASQFRRRGQFPAGQALAQWRTGSQPLLRRHRQAGRRQDPFEDLHKRIASRLIFRESDAPSASATMRRALTSMEG
jgi:2,3,4,5-tetrahydropyridine-2-carboxylate N-succinyltransferase